MIQTLVYRDNRYAGANPPEDQRAALRADPAVVLWVDLSESSDEEVRRVFGEDGAELPDCRGVIARAEIEHRVVVDFLMRRHILFDKENGIA